MDVPFPAIELSMRTAADAILASLKVLEYIEAENKYTEEILAHTVPLQEKLFDEMRQYVADEDADFPTPRNGTIQKKTSRLNYLTKKNNKKLFC